MHFLYNILIKRQSTTIYIYNPLWAFHMTEADMFHARRNDLEIEIMSLFVTFINATLYRNKNK